MTQQDQAMNHTIQYPFLPPKMKAVGLKAYLPISDEQSLLDISLPSPQPKGRDLLVQVHALSVNPVDTKVRSPKAKVEDNYRVLGWDAAGTVVAVGDQAELFKVGDQVYYAGDITRPGSNSEYQLVDERIVGKKPESLGFAEAAALPLTAITAAEGLFERLQINEANAAGKSLLIIGGAGGVGSIAIQLAKQLPGLRVIASASRTESADWCKGLGADDLVNHNKDLVTEVRALGLDYVDFIFCLNTTARHWEAMCELIKPQGIICSIVEPEAPLDLNLLKTKSAGFVWEFMFTRSRYQTADMIEQHRILNHLAQLIDQGKINTSLTKTLRPINAENLRKAHADLEAGKTIGKIVLSDWQ
jgi:NADPH:quinone reductase